MHNKRIIAKKYIWSLKISDRWCQFVITRVYSLPYEKTGGVSIKSKA